MQQELDAENPELNIKILGINEAGHESGNPDIIAGRDLPWLQDINDDGDGDSDTWESWDVTFRDVVITNAENEQVAVYNLTNNDLANSDNFAALKSLLLDAATSENEPSLDLAAIADVTVLAGSPLHIPLNGIDPQGQDLVFTAESDNSLVSTEVLTGNRSLRMEVDDFGVMTFELFEGRASRATQRMIELSDAGFYDDIIFHRVIDGFVIQGGDPTGTGSGGSTLSGATSTTSSTSTCNTTAPGCSRRPRRQTTPTIHSSSSPKVRPATWISITRSSACWSKARTSGNRSATSPSTVETDRSPPW